MQEAFTQVERHSETTVNHKLRLKLTAPNTINWVINTHGVGGERLIIFAASYHVWKTFTAREKKSVRENRNTYNQSINVS